MRLDWSNESGDCASLVAQIQEYDAFPPTRALKIDGLPARRHSDREALAAYLAFGRWASGDLALPSALSPFVAEAIERDASPIRVRPREIAYAPQGLPRGKNAVSVVFELPSSLPARPTLAVVPNVAARGVFSTGLSLIVPSNAFVLDHDVRDRLRGRLAVAVLFAADLDADALHVGQAGIDPIEAQRLRALLHCVNLGLEVAPGA